MTTETILTDEDLDRCSDFLREVPYDVDYDLDHIHRACRNTEQAVLQSEQVQAWRRDAEAFRLMVSKRLTVSVRELGHEVEVFYLDDCLAWPACDPNADDDTRAEVARPAIATAVAAMEQQT